jgi:hypothetical protein
MYLGNIIVVCLFVGDFFVVNNGLFVDLVKLQMLRCIIYRFNQTFGNVLAQRSTRYKGLIKYSKVDGVPMNTCVQIAHLKLLAQKKQFNKKVAEHVVHYVQQPLSILLCNY